MYIVGHHASADFQGECHSGLLRQAGWSRAKSAEEKTKHKDARGTLVASGQACDPGREERATVLPHRHDQCQDGAYPNHRRVARVND